jgi:hypothetical protein
LEIGVICAIGGSKIDDFLRALRASVVSKQLTVLSSQLAIGEIGGFAAMR